MLNRNMLLARAKQERTCPPLSVRRAEAHQKDMEHHKRLCPSCAMADTEALEAADELMQGVVDILRPSFKNAGGKSADQAAASGQLRPIRPDLGCWWQGYYYNPPLVLVVENTCMISNDLQAAQVYNETGLAGPGDLILTASQTGLEKLFVQPWNTYTLKADQLGPVVGRISPEIVQIIQRMADDPGCLPEWAPVTFPFRDHDPRLYFREIETEVGYVFSSRAVALLIQEVENTGKNLPTRDIVMADLIHLLPRGGWERPPINAEEALATFKEFKLAADEGKPSHFANYISLAKGRVQAFERIVIKNWHSVMTKEGFSVTGRIDVSENQKGYILKCYLETEGGEMLNSTDLQWEEGTGVFIASFDTNEEGQPKIAVLFFENEEDGQ